MSLKCLAVDSDLESKNAHIIAWAARGVLLDCAENMTEAIQKLQNNEYIFVGINADVIDFMPLLSTMRIVTSLPVFVVTCDFTTEKEIAALKAGADLYSRWHGSPQDNVESVLAHLSRRTANSEAPNKEAAGEVMIYRNLLLSASQRLVFIGNNRLQLTRQEFDLLHYLMVNEGIVLTYVQIYRFIWNDEYDGSTYATVKGLFKRLRKKLADVDGGSPIVIQNRWGVGYLLPLMAEPF